MLFFVDHVFDLFLFPGIRFVFDPTVISFDQDRGFSFGL